MSKTIRNEKTRGFLDKLQKQRETRKQIRAIKAEQLTQYFFEETFLPAAQI